MQISLCSFGDSSFSFPALCLGISGRCLQKMAFLFRFVPVQCLEQHVLGCGTKGRGSSVHWGQRWPGFPGMWSEGWQQRGSHIRQQASRSLLTTPNPPLRLENPFFRQRPLGFHQSAPVSSSYLCPGIPASSAQLLCDDPRVRSLVLCLILPYNVLCLPRQVKCCSPGLALQAPCREDWCLSGPVLRGHK